MDVVSQALLKGKIKKLSQEVEPMLKYTNVVKFTQKAILADGTIGNQLLVKFKYKNSDKDFLIEFDKCGVNKIFAIHCLYYSPNSKDTVDMDIEKTKALYKSVGTDIVGPYIVRCDDSTKDTGYTKQDFTGGWHGYSGSTTGSRTAQTKSYEIKFDGKLIDIFSGDITALANRIDIKVVNLINAYNTKTSNGQGVNVLEETVRYTIQDNSINIETSFKCLVPCTIMKYYGLQTANSVLWADSITYPNGQYTSRVSFDGGPHSGAKETYPDVDRWVAKGIGGTILAWLDNTYGLGNREYVSDDLPLAFSVGYGTSGKTYANLVNGVELALNVGDEYRWRGGLVILSELNKDSGPVDLIACFKDYSKDKLIIDCLSEGNKTDSYPSCYFKRDLKQLKSSGIEPVINQKPDELMIESDGYGTVEYEILK